MVSDSVNSVEFLQMIQIVKQLYSSDLFYQLCCVFCELNSTQRLPYYLPWVTYTNYF